MQQPRIYFDAEQPFPWGFVADDHSSVHPTWEEAFSEFDTWQQAHDWCPVCDRCTLYHGEFCGECGREWGYQHSEYNDKRDQLAKFLCDLAYAPGMWDTQADAGMRENYTLDAADIIAANPHLLSLPVRLAVLEGKSLEDDERESAA